MKKKSILFITIIFFCLHSMSQSWTWQQFTWDGQIWMRSYNNNNGQFDFCIGGGGCIEQMRYVPNSYQHLLSPSYQGEQTDRVIQWTYWGINVTDPNANVADQRFNIDQAGNHEGTFNETISVEIDGNLVDIFSVSRNQWVPILDSSFTATIPSFTRYEMLDQGVLKVKKVIRVTDIFFLSKKHC